MAAGKDRHYGRALAVQAEESEVMNAAAGSTPASLTSRKANDLIGKAIGNGPGVCQHQQNPAQGQRKTALLQQDGRSRKELVKNLMDNFTTLTAVKSSILEGLAILPPIVESLEHSGVRIISAESSGDKSHNILIGGGFDNFRRWADENELYVILEHDGKEGQYLQWRLSACVNGVEIKSFLSNKEKEEYDGENLGD